MLFMQLLNTNLRIPVKSLSHLLYVIFLYQEEKNYLKIQRFHLDYIIILDFIS